MTRGYCQYCRVGTPEPHCPLCGREHKDADASFDGETTFKQTLIQMGKQSHEVTWPVATLSPSRARPTRALSFPEGLRVAAFVVVSVALTLGVFALIGGER